MNWTNLCYSVSTDWVAEAWLLSRAWGAAAQSADRALLSNLHCNMFNPAGVCMALDAACVPVPEEVRIALAAARFVAF